MKRLAFPVVALKPIAGIVALGYVDILAVNEGGITVLEPAFVSAWTGFFGVLCYRRRRHFPQTASLLGWLWILTSAALASRALREADWLPAWYVEPWWAMAALTLPIAGLIGWRGQSPLWQMIHDSGAKRVRSAGLWTLAAVLAAPVALLAYNPETSQIKGVVVYTLCCAGSFACARLLRTPNDRSRRSIRKTGAGAGASRPRLRRRRGFRVLRDMADTGDVARRGAVGAPPTA